MRAFLLILAISFSSFGNESLFPSVNTTFNWPPFKLWKHQLDNINYSDGVSYREAEIIIKNFAYSEKAAGCGDIGIIVDYGVYWKAGTRVGFSASKGEPIFIHKKKAYISQDGEKLYSHPSNMVLSNPVEYLEFISGKK